jgi:YjbE family integral membrane protein
MTMEQAIILLQIILIDLVLAADNAIIIGMLASKFPPEIKNKILFWGVGAAVIARIFFTLIVAYLLNIQGLKLVGGLILLWVTYRLYLDVIKEQGGDEKKIQVKKTSLMSAIITIAVADISLSLDNVLGVAGAAKDHYVLLIFGLALSIIMMATMANYIAKWVKTYKWIGWLGLFAILIVAVDLIYADVKFFINQ